MRELRRQSVGAEAREWWQNGDCESQTYAGGHADSDSAKATGATKTTAICATKTTAICAGEGPSSAARCAKARCAKISCAKISCAKISSTGPTYTVAGDSFEGRNARGSSPSGTDYRQTALNRIDAWGATRCGIDHADSQSCQVYHC